MKETQKANIMIFIFSAIFALSVVFIQISNRAKHNNFLQKDADGYMHMLRLHQKLKTNNWHDNLVYKVNYPKGADLHWTLPFDYSLYGMVKIFDFYKDFDFSLKDKIDIAGFFISPIFLFLTFMTIIFGFSKEFGIVGKISFIIFFPFFSSMLGYMQEARADHHSMQIFMLALSLVFIKNIITSKNKTNFISAVFLSLSLSISLWIGMEGLFIIIVSYIFFSFLWVKSKENKIIENLFIISFFVFLFCGLWVFIENGANNFFVEKYDVISIVDLYFLLNILLIYSILMFFKNIDKKNKLILGFALAFLAFISVYLRYPLFFSNPYSLLNPRMKAIFFDIIAENKKIYDFGWYLFYLRFFKLLVIYALVFLYYKKGNKIKNDDLCLFLFFASLVYLALTSYSIRLNMFLDLINLCLLSLIMNRFFENLGFSKQKIIRVCFFVLFLFLLPQASQALSNKGKDLQKIENAKFSCRKDILEQKKEILKILPSNNRLVFTNLYEGPFLAWEFGYNVIGSAFHRNEKSIIFTHDVLKNKNFDKAKKILKTRNIDAILLCKKQGVKFYDFIKEGKKIQNFTKVDLSNNFLFMIKK